MQDADKVRFAEILTGVAEIRGRELGTGGIKIWWRMMRDISIDEFDTAIGHILSTSPHMPQPNDVLAIVQGTGARLEDLAALAWDKVQEGIARFGTRRSIVFDDPAIHLAVVSMGGWEALGRMPDNAWTRKDFEKLYQISEGRIRRMGVAATQPASVLLGTEDLGNNQGHPSPPKLVGDPVKVAEWHRLLPPEDRPQLEGPSPVLRLVEAVGK